MSARIVHKGFFWIGIAAAIGILALPVIIGGRSSGQNPWAGVGHALGAVILMLLLALVAVISSLVARIAASMANATPRAKLMCWLPFVLAPINGTVNVLVLVEMGVIG